LLRRLFGSGDAPVTGPVKAIVGLGNPGAEYAATRHNVGWWLADHLVEVWGLGRFRKDGNALVAAGRVGGTPVRVVKPQTYMNRSGGALSPLLRLKGFEPSRDLLVLVDDVALEPGRVRFRAAGSAGGHNGLKSVQSVLGSQVYPRLRIGVGTKPEGWDLADWVLSRVPRPEREAILERFPELVDGVELWMREGTEAAMSRHNA
jgi:peptidyl-tRNA hydrolase, PTH1 family